MTRQSLTSSGPILMTMMSTTTLKRMRRMMMMKRMMQKFKYTTKADQGGSMRNL